MAPIGLEGYLRYKTLETNFSHVYAIHSFLNPSPTYQLEAPIMDPVPQSEYESSKEPERGLVNSHQSFLQALFYAILIFYLAYVGRRSPPLIETISKTAPYSSGMTINLSNLSLINREVHFICSFMPFGAKEKLQSIAFDKQVEIYKNSSLIEKLDLGSSTYRLNFAQDSQISDPVTFISMQAMSYDVISAIIYLHGDSSNIKTLFLSTEFLNFKAQSLILTTRMAVLLIVIIFSFQFILNPSVSRVQSVLLIVSSAIALNIQEPLIKASNMSIFFSSLTSCAFLAYLRALVLLSLTKKNHFNEILIFSMIYFVAEFSDTFLCSSGDFGIREVKSEFYVAQALAILFHISYIVALLLACWNSYHSLAPFFSSQYFVPSLVTLTIQVVIVRMRQFSRSIFCPLIYVPLHILFSVVNSYDEFREVMGYSPVGQPNDEEEFKADSATSM